MFSPHDLFIAIDGNDEWNGSNDLANPKRKIGPLASLRGAFDRIRLMKKNGTLAAPVVIWVHGGNYPLSKTVVITAEDSAPVTFRAYPGETPVFDGGIRLGGWTKTKLNGKTVWKALLPSRIDWTVDQFFVNGQRCRRASFPKEGYYHVPGTPLKDPVLFNGVDHFPVNPGDFNSSWYDLEGIEALVLHKWIEERMPAKAFDGENNIFYSTHRSCFELDPCDTEYRWENVREALTEAGEYYVDRNEKTIYYLPRKGEKAETVTAVIPALGSFIRFEGEPEKGKYVEWINFEGLTFLHGGGFRPAVESDYDFHDPVAPELRNYAACKGWIADMKQSGHVAAGAPQGAVHVPGTIFFHGARNCAIRDCTVAESGWYGIAIANGCTGVRVEGNHLHDLGAGGVRIGGVSAAAVAEHPQLLTTRSIVTDNHIHHCGEMQLSACGIIVFHAAANLIEHNHIHDLYYTGISCGWNWGYGESVTRENRIGWNLIHDLGKGIISDMGGIYLLGIQPGTRVYNNLISKISCRHYGGWGIYTDEGSAHVVIEKNICHDCSCEAFHQHYGRENIVRHNIFALCGDAGVAISAGTGRDTGYAYPGANYATNVTFLGNIVITDGKPFFRSGYMIESISLAELFSENNCFWDVAGKNKIFAKGPDDWETDWKGWRKMGHDRASEFADPGMIDIGKRNFRLRPGSPLRQGIFRDLDLTGVGVRCCRDQGAK